MEQINQLQVELGFGGGGDPSLGARHWFQTIIFGRMTF